MGQVQSDTTDNSVVTLDDTRREVFSLWPGLDGQLEASFASMLIKETDLLPYETLEPILRHLLMQIGLIEYVTRFATPTGKLDSSYVSHYLREYKVDLSKDFNVDDWKNLMLSWIKRVQDTQEQDIANWELSVKKMQEEQAYKYQIAMRQFQKHYIEQLEGYYKSIEDVYKQEEDYRREWETSLGLQEEFYNTQMQYLQSRNEAAMTHFGRQMGIQANVHSELLKHLKVGRENGPGGLSTVNFLYPVNVTSTGAPVSGGARVPTRRLIKRSSSVCC